MYQYCDLRWGSIIATGLLALLAGIVALLFPPAAKGFAVIFSGLAILILAGIVIDEGLFSENQGIPAGVIFGIGILGIALGALTILAPAWLIATAGVLIGASLIIFGAIMVWLAAAIVFSDLIRLLVLISSLLAIVLGIWALFAPAASLEIFFSITGAFLILYGIIRITYGILLRSWQKTCPASYREGR